MASKSINAVSNQFIALAKKPKLTKSERHEAWQLMGSLKQAGLSNDEISELSGGKWSANTVKFYTKGVKASPTQCDNLVQLLQGLNSCGLTLAGVEKTVATHEELKAHNITLDDISDVLFAAESSSMDIADLVHQLKTYKEYSLTPEKISEVLDTKKHLDAMGVGLDSLVSLFEAIKKYGNPSAALEAISAYSSLLEIKEKIKAAEKELEKVKAIRGDQEKQIELGKKTLEALTAPIEAYKEVKELGFDEEALSNLDEVCQKFGGHKGVLQALKTYEDYKKLENNIVEAHTKLFDLKSAIAKLQSEHGNLTTGIDICLKLIGEYHFGLDGIEMLLSAARKYGEPLDVLRAVTVYGSIQALLEEVDKHQGILNASKQKIDQLNGEYEASLEKLHSLNALALQVGGEVNKVHYQAADNIWINQLVKLINDPYSADYGTHINAAIVLGRALKAFVTKYQSNFKHRSPINDGLAFLITDLGGVSDITG